MAIKEVTDIRLNGKSWRNCNGKELNSLTVNGTTYKLVKNYYTIRFNDLVGDGTGYYEVGGIPEGSKVNFGYAPGDTSITVYINNVFHARVNLSPKSYKVFMELSLNSITNISRDYEIDCKWSKIIGEIQLAINAFYQSGQQQAGICTVEIEVSSYEHIAGTIDTSKLSLADEAGYLGKVGSSWVSQSVPRGEILDMMFSYYQGSTEGYYSVFIEDGFYSGIEENVYPVEILPPMEDRLLLKIVDNSYK